MQQLQASAQARSLLAHSPAGSEPEVASDPGLIRKPIIGWQPVINCVVCDQAPGQGGREGR